MKAGYGQPGTGLHLDLVYNPNGIFLAPQQSTLEVGWAAVHSSGGSAVKLAVLREGDSVLEPKMSGWQLAVASAGHTSSKCRSFAITLSSISGTRWLTLHCM